MADKVKDGDKIVATYVTPVVGLNEDALMGVTEKGEVIRINTGRKGTFDSLKTVSNK